MSLLTANKMPDRVRRSGAKFALDYATVPQLNWWWSTAAAAAALCGATVAAAAPTWEMR